MSIEIYHAVCNENGEIEKGQKGDQKQEIRKAKWYAKNDKGAGWLCILICNDAEIVERAIAYAKAIEESPLFGYAQDARWTGYDSIVANGGELEGAQPGDFDCISYLVASFMLAGLDVQAAAVACGYESYEYAYSGNLEKILMATGKFTMISDASKLTSEKYAVRGAIYLRRGHGLMTVQNGSLASELTGAQADEETTVTRVRVNVTNWCNVRSSPGLNAVIIGRAVAGQDFDVYSKSAGWYCINFNGQRGYIFGELVVDIDEVEGADASYVLVTGGTVNIRKKPTAESTLLGYVRKGVKLEYLGETSADGWHKVKYKGQEAYISGRLSRLS